MTSRRTPGNQSENPHGDAFPERANAWKNRKVSAYAFLWAPYMQFRRMKAWKPNNARELLKRYGGRPYAFALKRHTIEWMLKAARIDQRAKRQLNLEFWNVSHTVQSPKGANLPKWKDFLKNLISFKSTVRGEFIEKASSTHNMYLGNGMSCHVKGALKIRVGGYRR